MSIEVLSVVYRGGMPIGAARIEGLPVVYRGRKPIGTARTSNRKSLPCRRPSNFVTFFFCLAQRLPKVFKLWKLLYCIKYDY